MHLLGWYIFIWISGWKHFPPQAANKVGSWPGRGRGARPRAPPWTWFQSNNPPRSSTPVKGPWSWEADWDSPRQMVKWGEKQSSGSQREVNCRTDSSCSDHFLFGRSAWRSHDHHRVILPSEATTAFKEIFTHLQSLDCLHMLFIAKMKN